MAHIKYSESKNSYRNKDAIHNVIHYINNSSKLVHNIKGALGCNYDSSKSITKDMLDVQKCFNKKKGKRINHFTVCFSPAEEEILQIDDYLTIGYKIASFFPNEYQIFFALHENTDNMHIHFAMNPVSFVTGKKFHWQKKDSHALKCRVEEILREYLY